VRFEFGHDFELMPVVLQESRLEERSHQKKKHGQVSGLQVASWSFMGHPFHSSIHSSATMQGSSSPEQGFP
jgi:hypothetical protein